MPLLKEVAASQATQQREPPKTITQSTKLSKSEEQRAARAWAEAISLGGDLSCADPADEEC